jgi:chlorite dismutase
MPISSETQTESSIEPLAGWHCTHLFYRFDRSRLRNLGHSEIADGRREFMAALDRAHPSTPKRLQTFLVSGHKADFGLLMLDANPLALDGVHQRLMSGPLGSALRPTYSFVSMTEVSEYVPTVEQYRQRLAAEGADPAGAEYQTAIRQYENRWAIIQRQRLQPDLPSWPALCFYPMNKRREADANWFLLAFDARERLMRQHGETGLEFAGKVTQLVTGSMGLDDWEWGVTLWARSPQYLKEIVYRMRFDEASARYADFGPFYVGYQAPAEAILTHCHVGTDAVTG